MLHAILLLTTQTPCCEMITIYRQQTEVAQTVTEREPLPVIDTAWSKEQRVY